MGRGATGRLVSLLAAGRKFEFTVLRGVAFTFGTPAFALGRFTFAGRFVLPFAFAFAFSFAFLFLGGLFGLFSFLFAADVALRFSVDSSGVTLSGDSPAFVGRLISIATVCPVLTTSPARGNWNTTVSGLASLLGLVARTRNFRSASARIRSASNRSLPTTSGTFTSGLRKER